MQKASPSPKFDVLWALNTVVFLFNYTYRSNSLSFGLDCDIISTIVAFEGILLCQDSKR